MRGLVSRGPQAPRAAAGEVRPDPLPLHHRIHRVDVLRVEAVQRDGALPEFPFSVGVAEELGGVGAHHRALHGGLLG